MMMEKETKIELLMKYFDRLNTANANGFKVNKEINDVINALHREFEISEKVVLNYNDIEHEKPNGHNAVLYKGEVIMKFDGKK